VAVPKPAHFDPQVIQLEGSLANRFVKAAVF
jgi:hypothetical protein